MFAHLIDALPFILGLVIVLVGPSVISFKTPIKMIVVFTTGVYLLAQSTWFTAFMNGNEWGRDWANYIWFVFNTCTMGVFLWILFKRD